MVQHTISVRHTVHYLSRSHLFSRVYVAHLIFECTMNTNERTISYWHCFQFYCYVYSFEYIYCNVYPFQRAHIFHIFQFLFVEFESKVIVFARHTTTATQLLSVDPIFCSLEECTAHTVTEPIRSVVTLLLLPMPLWNVLHYIRMAVQQCCHCHRFRLAAGYRYILIKRKHDDAQGALGIDTNTYNNKLNV